MEGEHGRAHLWRSGGAVVSTCMPRRASIRAGERESARELTGEMHVEHRSFVNHHRIRLQRVVRRAHEAALPWIVLEEPRALW